MSTSNMALMYIRRVIVWWTFDIEDYKQSKPETKIPL